MENPLNQLIRRLARLPGLGPRSARRAVLHLLRNRDTLMLPLAAEIDAVARRIRACVQCGNFDTGTLCRICQDTARDRSRICVVEDIADLWAMERAGIYGGLYHVLGGVMSAIDGVGPDDLRIPLLVRRAGEATVAEVILATSATVDGQTTAHYIAEKLMGANDKIGGADEKLMGADEELMGADEKLGGAGVIITRLAHGVPVGGELDYLDEGTLAQAMKARRRVGD